MLKRGARQGGMTLVEVLVAMAIVALVLAFAGPSALTWIQNTQLRNAAEAILGGVERARIEALKRNTTVAFELTDANSTAFHVCYFDIPTIACSTTKPDLATRGPSEGSLNARAGVGFAVGDTATPIDGGTNVPSLIAFDSFGRVAASSPQNIARIDVRNLVAGTGERRLVILVASGGQIRMCDPALSQATNPQGCK